MPIVFEEMTGEIANERPTGAPVPNHAPQPEDGLREKIELELALMRERQARIFAD